jgi:hypothetical protein
MRYHCFKLATLLTAFFILCAAGVSAQQEKPWAGFGIEDNFIAGRVWKHEDKFTLPIPALSTGEDINFVLQTHGKKDWEQRRHFPLLGIGFNYTHYGIDSVYGRCYSIYPNIQLSLISGKRLEWTVRLGDGVGYVTKRFQRSAPVDTINGAIGSHINDFAMLMTDLRYHINKHLDVQLGANFQHISDGSFRQPNLGINMYGAHIGIRYSLVDAHPKKIIRDLPKLKNRWLIQARVTMAGDEYAAPQGPEFPVYLAALYVSKRWLSKNKVFGGIDYSYHESIYAFLRNNEIDPGQEAAHSWKSAIFVGNEFLVGRFGILGQVGVYIKQAYLKTDPYYEKLGLNYYIIRKEQGPFKELFLTGMLLTHQATAELAEFGLGAGF